MLVHLVDLLVGWASGVCCEAWNALTDTVLIIEDRKCRARPDSGLNCLVGQLLLAVPQNLGKAYENSQDWLSY